VLALLSPAVQAPDPLATPDDTEVLAGSAPRRF